MSWVIVKEAQMMMPIVISHSIRQTALQCPTPFLIISKDLAKTQMLKGLEAIRVCAISLANYWGWIWAKEDLLKLTIYLKLVPLIWKHKGNFTNNRLKNSRTKKKRSKQSTWPKTRSKSWKISLKDTLEKTAWKCKHSRTWSKEQKDQK